MHYGTIVLYRPAKGFGFIREPDRPSDLFFHATQFEGSEELIRVGARVEYSLGEHNGKPVARAIRLLDAGDNVEQEFHLARAVLKEGSTHESDARSNR
jgi:cold shock CspA family protein